MAAISQTMFSYAFYGMKIYEFREQKSLHFVPKDPMITVYPKKYARGFCFVVVIH